jgi:excisionase family DNA binding protein
MSAHVRHVADELEQVKMPATNPKIDMRPYAMTISDAVKWTGIGRTRIYEYINEGQLDAVKIGTRTLITTASLERLIASAPKLGAA